MHAKPAYRGRHRRPSRLHLLAAGPIVALALALAGCAGNPDPKPYDTAQQAAGDLNEAGYSCDFQGLSDHMADTGGTGEQFGAALGQEMAKQMLGVEDMGSCGSGNPAKAAILIYPDGQQSSAAIETMIRQETGSDEQAYTVTGPNWQVFTPSKSGAADVASAIGGEVASMRGGS